MVTHISKERAHPPPNMLIYYSLRALGIYSYLSIVGKEIQVKIINVGVYGLFDRFNHDIAFNHDESITIIIGPNGFGKTTILRILDRIFNLPLRLLRRMPFKEVHIEFDDSSKLQVLRQPMTEGADAFPSEYDVSLRYMSCEGFIEEFTPGRLTSEEVPFPIGIIEDIISDIDQIGRSTWRKLSSGEILGLEDVLDLYADYLPISHEIHNEVPSWLVNIRKSVPVRFIGTERLTYSTPDEPVRPIINFNRTYPESTQNRTVRIYSEQLGQMVKGTLAEYGTLSQALDRTFPVRLVEEPTTPTLQTLELKKKLAEVEERRSEIVKAGLLAQGDEGFSVPIIDNVDPSRRGVLDVYAEDAMRKLRVFDNLYTRVNIFKRIANTRLLYKEVSVGESGLKVDSLGQTDLDLEMLSSGEQHELVLLFDLLFNTKENSLIMIDEPELSLHVDWQEALLGDLKDMATLSSFHALLATHSPEIIGDRWDLTVALKGPTTV